jgi:hypothetical protein
MMIYMYQHMVFIYSTNCTMGRVWTLYKKETPCCFQLGPQGCCLCLATIPCSIYFPLQGLVCLGFINNIIREKIIHKYNVKEQACCDENATCGKCCNCIHINCNYPCSFFQMEMALLEWEASL